MKRSIKTALFFFCFFLGLAANAQTSYVQFKRFLFDDIGQLRALLIEKPDSDIAYRFKSVLKESLTEKHRFNLKFDQMIGMNNSYYNSSLDRDCKMEQLGCFDFGKKVAVISTYSAEKDGFNYDVTLHIKLLNGDGSTLIQDEGYVKEHFISFDDALDLVRQLEFQKEKKYEREGSFVNYMPYIPLKEGVQIGLTRDEMVFSQLKKYYQEDSRGYEHCTVENIIPFGSGSSKAEEFYSSVLVECSFKDYASEFGDAFDFSREVFYLTEAQYLGLARAFQTEVEPQWPDLNSLFSLMTRVEH